MRNPSRERKPDSGFLGAFGIFGLSVVSYPLALMYSRLLSGAEVASIYASPLTWLVTLVFLALDFLCIYASYSKIGRYLAKPDPSLLDGAHKTLIGFPRQIILISLVLSILSFQLILSFFPALASRRLEHLFLGFANEVFFGIPMYILFYQHIEKWASAIPYTAKYTALKLSARIAIVVMFSILAVCSLLIITMRESVRLGADAAALIASITARSLPIVGFGFVVGVINIQMIMRGVAYRISDSNYFAYQLGEGNLRGASFSVVPRDELGTLSNGLNLVRDKISALILSTKSTVRDTMTAKDRLLAVAAITEEAVSAIDADVREVNGKVEGLNERTDNVLRSMEAVNRDIEALDGQIAVQATQVDESTAAVTQMIASLNSISSITSRKLETTGRLLKATDDGRLRLSDTVEMIKQMNESVENIGGMAQAIQGIATRTNLLAMNAAIEAAHAGDYGRGFAVVADEIRKLAETAARNSKEINGNIKRIVALIRQATDSGAATSEAFKAMNVEIDSVVSSFTEIEGSVSELKSGGEQILESVSMLRDISSNVTKGSGTMARETESVKGAMAEVNDFFAQTKTVTAHMTDQIQRVAECSEDIASKSRDIDAVTSRISDSLSAFKTE
jgi:methyl-accepting chemotaxis protein